MERPFDLEDALDRAAARAGGEEQAMLDAVKYFREVLAAAPKVLRPRAVEALVGLSVECLNHVAAETDYYEFMEALDSLSAEMVGQVVLKALPAPDGRWPVAAKAFWMTVAEELGPDHVETFRSLGAFMKRVDSF